MLAASRCTQISFHMGFPSWPLAHTQPGRQARPVGKGRAQPGLPRQGGAWERWNLDSSVLSLQLQKKRLLKINPEKGQKNEDRKGVRGRGGSCENRRKAGLLTWKGPCRDSLGSQEPGRLESTGVWILTGSLFTPAMRNLKTKRAGLARDLRRFPTACLFAFSFYPSLDFASNHSPGSCKYILHLLCFACTYPIANSFLTTIACE